ncbi:MAG TPA: glycosyl hydrolase family 28-related protein, partial [Terracidiphilus sp.]|nr:glycosyl hydrolase family 28-related protein [Terracidiphilus sp.]
MNFTKSRWLRAARWAAVCTIAMMAGAHVNAQAITTTTVDGTVYLASGQPASGTVQISWPAFTTAANQAVAAGRTSVTIGAGGSMSVNLAPNEGASPAGLYYTAVYYLSDGTTSTEYWVVPAAAQATLAQVRAQVMPAAQALQTASKAYVDQAVQSVSQGSLITSGGTIAGPLYLNGDPTTALQAATKQYVDASAAARASLTATGRQSFAGPITTPGITSSVNGVINVLAPPYNAKGDGVTDDHDAIVAACNAAKASNPPAVVYFPLTTAGKYLTSTIVNSCMGVSMEGPLSSSGISSTSPRVTIQGEPGEDLFEQQAPGTYSGAAPARSWSIRDLNLVIDTSVAGSHPHRWPGRWITDAGMTSGSAVITSPHALFSCGDVGQAIKVDGAGASGADLVTTIASVSPCLSDTPTVTLAATASTTVSNAHAYISLGGLPVTTAVGSCVMAWDDSDGNSANNTTSGPIGNQDDSFYNVSFSSLSPANTYGDYNTCGLFFQGQWGPYALSAREVAVNGLYFGVLQTGSELNPYLNSASGDFEKWDHGLWRNMTFP